MSKKKMQDQVTAGVDGLFKAISSSITDISAKSSDKALSFAEMARKAERVDIKIEKYDVKDKKWKHFLILNGQIPAEVEATGFHELCKYQGGGGSYTLEYTFDDAAKTSRKVNNIEVAGEGWMEARVDREARGLPGIPTSVLNGLASNGLPSMPSGNGVYSGAMGSDILKQANEGFTTALSTQQRSSDQMMQMFMSMMMNNNNNRQQGGPTETERMMQEQMRRQEEELRRLREDQAEERRRAAEERAASRAAELERRLEEVKASQVQSQQNQMFEFLKMSQDKGSSSTDAMLNLFALNRSDSKESTMMQMQMLKEMMQRPDPTASTSKVLETVMAATVSNMNMLQQAAASGLLGGGGSHPGWELAGNALEGLSTAIGMHLESKGAAQEQQAGAIYNPNNLPYASEVPMTVPALPAAPMMAGLPPMVEEPVEVEEEAQEIQEVKDRPDFSQVTLQDLLSSIEKEHRLDEITFTKISKDSALMSAIDKLKKGIDVHEITARIFAHANHGNEYAQNWLSFPVQWSAQLLMRFGGQHRAVELVENIVNFIEDLNTVEGFDPDEWAKATGYRPLKKADEIPVGATPVTTTRMAQTKRGKRPSMGSTQGPMPETVPFDPSIPPPEAEMTKDEAPEDNTPEESAPEEDLELPENPEEFDDLEEKAS